MLSTDDPFPAHSKLIDEQYNSSKDYHPNSGLPLEGGKAPEVDIKVERERYRQKLWSHIVKKEVPKMAKMFAMSRHNVVTNNKKVSYYSLTNRSIQFGMHVRFNVLMEV